MIPLRDNVAPSGRPYIVMAIMLANVAIFAYELFLPDSALSSFVRRFAVVPSEFAARVAHDPTSVMTLVSTTFMHNSPAHLLGNLLFLQVFGNNVEGRLGHRDFLLLYLFSGAVAILVQVVFQLNACNPNVGASGSVAGVLGAYMLMYPKAKVLTLTPIFIIIPLPAIFFIKTWLIIQIIRGAMTMSDSLSCGVGVAWWAHVGGFTVGVLATLAFAKAERTRMEKEILKEGEKAK